MQMVEVRTKSPNNSVNQGLNFISNLRKESQLQDHVKVNDNVDVDCTLTISHREALFCMRKGNHNWTLLI